FRWPPPGVCLERPIRVGRNDELGPRGRDADRRSASSTTARSALSGSPLMLTPVRALATDRQATQAASRCRTSLAAGRGKWAHRPGPSAVPVRGSLSSRQSSGRWAFLSLATFVAFVLVTALLLGGAVPARADQARQRQQWVLNALDVPAAWRV